MRFTSKIPLRASIVVATAGVLSVGTHAQGSTWNQTTGGSWAVAGNWTGGVPNAIGASADFTGINSANRTITNDGGAAGQTVGSISFDTTGAGAFTNSLTTGTTGSNLILNNGGAGVTITAAGTGTGNNTISVPISFSDNVTANVTSTSATSAAGALNLTATITGSGGFTKAGAGLATFGTGAKTYTGATNLNGGFMRISLAAAPTATSSFRVNGAQFIPIADGSFTLGTGSVFLNGAGPGNAGALRPDRTASAGRVLTITNPVVLESNTTIHSQTQVAAPAARVGQITLSNVVSGPGELAFTAAAHDENLGTLVLSNNNTYTGGTLVRGGTVQVTGASSDLGAGNVTVLNASLVNGSATARLLISAGVLNAIADDAVLSLAGGNAPGTADQGFADLQYAGTDVIGGLVLGGVVQTLPGTYGSSTSGATHVFDEFFIGPGTVFIPEPTSLAVLGLGGLALVRRRRG